MRVRYAVSYGWRDSFSATNCFNVQIDRGRQRVASRQVRWSAAILVLPDPREELTRERKVDARSLYGQHGHEGDAEVVILLRPSRSPPDKDDDTLSPGACTRRGEAIA
jgi:hypothetical protein